MATIQKCVWLDDGKSYKCFKSSLSGNYILINMQDGWECLPEDIELFNLSPTYIGTKLWAVGFSEIKLLNKIYLGGE